MFAVVFSNHSQSPWELPCQNINYPALEYVSLNSDKVKNINIHTNTSRKTIFWWTVQSTASPSSGTIRITSEGDKDIRRKNHFTFKNFLRSFLHLAKSEGRLAHRKNEGRERLGSNWFPDLTQSFVSFCFWWTACRNIGKFVLFSSFCALFLCYILHVCNFWSSLDPS